MSNCYNYSRLGNSCDSQTNALTSNAKFINPLSLVYYKPWTPMMRYPGHNGINNSGMDNIDNAVTLPEHIKAFESKDSSPYFYHNNGQYQSTSSNIPQKSCKSCSSM